MFIQPVLAVLLAAVGNISAATISERSASLNWNDYDVSWDFPASVHCDVHIATKTSVTISSSQLQTAAKSRINAPRGSFQVNIPSSVATAFGLHISFDFDVTAIQIDMTEDVFPASKKQLWISAKGVAVYDSKGKKYLNKNCSPDIQHD